MDISTIMTGPPPNSGPSATAETAETVKYENASAESLELLLSEEKSRLQKLPTDNAAFNNLIEESKVRIEMLQNAVLAAYRREATAKPQKPPTHFDSKPVFEPRSQWERRLQQHCSLLNKFKGQSPEELTAFVTDIQQIFEILVQDKDQEHHRFFLDELKLKLDSTIQGRLRDAGGAESFDHLVKWLRDNYGEAYTSYQLLSKAWSAEYKSGTQFVNYSAAIERHMRTARDHIKASWAKNNSGQEMTVDDTFELFTGMLMVEVVRKESFEVYQAMTNKLDTLTTAAKVAAEAETIRTQYGAKSLSAGEKTFYAPKSGSKTKPYSKDPPKSTSLTDRAKTNENEVCELKKILVRIEAKLGQSNSSQPSGGKSKGKRDRKKSDQKSENRNSDRRKEESQNQKSDSANHSEIRESYQTENCTLDAPDLSEALIRAGSGFH